MKRIGITVLFLIAALQAFSQTSAPKGFRADLLQVMKGTESHITKLAEAMPENTYKWTPMEGVRSVGQVYMHITGANYLLLSFVGAKPPVEYKDEPEKQDKDKATIVAELKKSIEFINAFVASVSDDSLDNSTKFFGQTMTYRAVLLEAATHMNEHLGQSIAYARMNKIVPPWTAAQQAQEKKETKK
jgi:uncharacterized damage-inducible protein DinB